MRRVSALYLVEGLSLESMTYCGAAGEEERKWKHTFFGNFLFDFAWSVKVSTL